MSRWRIIGIARGAGTPKELTVAEFSSRGYRESIPISALPFRFDPFFLGLFFFLPLSDFPLPNIGAVRSVRFACLSLVRSARVISARQAFDLRFCGERAIKKCRENNIATVKSVVASL